MRLDGHEAKWEMTEGKHHEPAQPVAPGTVGHTRQHKFIPLDQVQM